MKTSWILVLALVTLTAGCSRQTKKPSPLLALADARFAAMNRHDSNALAAMYAADAVIQSPNIPKTETGASAARTIFHRYFTTSPDMVYQVTRMLPGDSSVTIEYVFGGTMKQLEKEVPSYMSGKYYKVRACNILEFRNGKISADVTYFDQVSFLQQVGFFEKHDQ